MSDTAPAMTRLTCLLPLFAAVALAQPADAPTRTSPGAPLSKEDTERALYALGVSLGRTVDGFALSPEEVEKVVVGLRAAAAGTVPADAMDPPPRLREFEVQRRDKRLALEKERGARFAAEAAKEKGAQVTPSGLVYVTVSEGVGPSPTPVDTVKVHYRGRLIDGREFDSSYRRGEPTTFALRQVVPCWTEALQKMKANGRAKVICPSAIAYGDKGNPPTIPPGATLVFDVELLDVLQRGSTTIH
jgi:FKBP-type peptidyl-prolyl cis-trans isomerase FkpA